MPENRDASGNPVFNASGNIDMNSNDITEIGILEGNVHTKVLQLPLRGVTDTEVAWLGELRTVTQSETGDYATDFAVSDHHVYLYINSITGSGDVTITGTSVDESTGVPTGADTEVITVDTASMYYQTSKKWWEVTNIDIPAGITVIDYDVGVVGYADFLNDDFTIVGFRLEAFAQGASADFRFTVYKIQDDGSNKMSIVIMEDVGILDGDAGNQIIDHLRTGGDERSYNPTVGNIWGDNTVICLKNSDYSTYFSSDENSIEGATKNEGIIIRLLGESGGLTNVDYITLILYYQNGV